MVAIPDFAPTPLDAIEPTVKKVHDAFNSQVTKPLEFRLQQLRKLYWSFEDNNDAIIEACKKDLGKPAVEAQLTEIDHIKNEIIGLSNNLHKWAADEYIPDTPFMMSLMSPRIRKEPYGACLIIGAYNYPNNVTFGPLIGAIAAGNTVVIKPSEQTPHVAAVAAQLLAPLDQSCYACVQGGIDETSALLDQHWDKIFYTGGQAVGRIIARKAAEHLTPVTLELGGKNPAFVTAGADVPTAARRLLWAKAWNAGQTCLSPNYILVDADTAPRLVTELKAAHAEFYPEGARQTADFGRIATPRHWQRLKGLLDKTGGEIVVGGNMDEATRFLEPTVVRVSSADDPLVQEENFGPILTVLPVPSLEGALRTANAVDPTPLAASAFGTPDEVQEVLSRQRSGGASVGDAFFHAILPSAPFGGVGTSGTGAYRGRHTFDCFSHRRSVVKVPGWLESAFSMRYPPYTDAKIKKLRADNKKPNFDREGRVKGNWLWKMVSAGGLGTAGLLLAFGIKQYLDRRVR